MKRTGLLFLFSALLIAGIATAWEDPSDGGVLTSTGTTVNNTTTGVPFTLTPGATYAAQCDAAACIRAGLGSSTAASCTLSSANAGPTIQASQLYDIPLTNAGPKQADTIAMVSVSGTANCRFWRVVLP